MQHRSFPPKNRRRECLPILRKEIEDANGVSVFDPNGLVMALLTDLDRLLEMPPLADAGPTSSGPAGSAGSGRASDLSGEPAVLYRSDDLEIALTPAELVRYIAHDLAPEEYFALRERFGMHFEIHDDFYDEETGEAVQPVELGRSVEPGGRGITPR